MESLVEKAKALAVTAHAGQLRKTFNPDQMPDPYIIHPARIVDKFPGEPLLQIVAWLHDTVEDTAVTLDEVRREFGVDVADAVAALTRREGEPYSAFIARSARNPLALRVKIEDIKDNLVGLPPGHGLEKRYMKALQELEQISLR